jgi:hypothetical protein
VVLGYGRDHLTARIDARFGMRHYRTVATAVGNRLPGAALVLRPHPADDLAPVLELMRRCPGVDAQVDTTTAIVDLLGEADLCIGVPSTAAFQAALVGTPVIVSNVSGFEWEWPLGEATTVPVARSEAELVEWLDRWLGGAPLAGREELLRALGANGADATDRLVRILS